MGKVQLDYSVSLSISNLVLSHVQTNGFSDPTDSQKGEEPPLQWPGARSQGGVIVTQPGPPGVG